MIIAPVVTLVLAASFGTFTVMPTVNPIEELPVEPASVELENAIGSGCQLGTVDIAMAPDNSAFVVRYSDFEALVGVGAKVTDSRKNCQLVVLIKPPAGYTYTIEAVDLSATVNLQDTATATMKSNFYSAGIPPSYIQSRTIIGPVAGAWNWSYRFEVSAQVWYPCFEQRYVNLSNELRVAGRNSDLTTTTSRARLAPPDSTGASVTYHLRWASCRLPE